MGQIHVPGFFSLVIAYLSLMFIPCQEASAQICRPAVERTGELGCWITVHAELGELPRGPIFWHLDTYATAFHVIVPGGPPMHLTATGTETRRALVLILHDSTQPPTTPAPDWTPRGLCGQRPL
jgi:hypothetical protein